MSRRLYQSTAPPRHALGDYPLAFHSYYLYYSLSAIQKLHVHLGLLHEHVQHKCTGIPVAQLLMFFMLKKKKVLKKWRIYCITKRRQIPEISGQVMHKKMFCISICFTFNINYTCSIKLHVVQVLYWFPICPNSHSKVHTFVRYTAMNEVLYSIPLHLHTLYMSKMYMFLYISTCNMYMYMQPTTYVHVCPEHVHDGELYSLFLTTQLICTTI